MASNYSGTIRNDLLHGRNPISSLIADLQASDYYNVQGAKYNWKKKDHVEDYKTINIFYKHVTPEKLKEIVTDIGNNRDDSFHGEDIKAVSISMFIGGAMLAIKDVEISNLTTILLNMYNMITGSDVEKRQKSATFLMDMILDNENYITNRDKFDSESSKIGLSLDFVVKGKKKITDILENIREDSALDNNNSININQLLSHELDEMAPPNIGDIYDTYRDEARDEYLRESYADENLQREFIERQQEEHNILDDVQTYQLHGERDSDIGYGFLRRNRAINAKIAKRLKRH